MDTVHARIKELESLTHDINWTEWFDAVEILSSQEGFKQRAERFERALNLCAVQAGMADPADACRAILATINKVLTEPE